MSEVTSDVKTEVLEDMVRTELTQQASAPQPDPDRLLHHVARTRRRTTVTATAAVMVLVIVVGVGTGVWIAQPTTNNPTALPHDANPGDPPQIYFTDPDHGYALADTCPDPCDIWLAYTTDGGRSWHGHTIPGLPTRDVRMHVANPATVVLDPANGDTRWRTDDSGRTWTRSPITPAGLIDHIPPTATALVNEVGLIVVLTPDGQAKTLSNFNVPSGGGELITATDGSIWVRYRAAARVSRDSGRTWQPVDLPHPCTFDTHDGVHLYCGDGLMVWRKTGPAEWQQLTPPATGRPSPQPGGGVLLTDTTTGDTYYAGPTDPDFTPTDRPDLGRTGTGARRLRPAGTGFEHSADGHTWTPLTF